MHLTFKPNSDNCHVMQRTNLVRFETHQKFNKNYCVGYYAEIYLCFWISDSVEYIYKAGGEQLYTYLLLVF